MDYSDESYVRLYTRDTKTWLRLGFEGQTVLMHLLRKLDRAGVLDGMDEPESDLALVTRVPLAFVQEGLPRLLQWEVVHLVGNRLVVPNFIEAQAAARTEKARQRDSRDKRASEARFVTGVTTRDIRSQNVTPSHDPSQSVTVGHDPSQPVTLSLAIPSSANPNQARQSSDPERARDPEPSARGPEPEQTRSPPDAPFDERNPSPRFKFRHDWKPTKDSREYGRQLGLVDDEMRERAEHCRLKLYTHPFSSEDEQYRRELLWLRNDKEKQQFRDQRKSNPNGLDENPGAHRRSDDPKPKAVFGRPSPG